MAAHKKGAERKQCKNNSELAKIIIVDQSTINDASTTQTKPVNEIILNYTGGKLRERNTQRARG